MSWLADKLRSHCPHCGRSTTCMALWPPQMDSSEGTMSDVISKFAEEQQQWHQLRRDSAEPPPSRSESDDWEVMPGSGSACYSSPARCAAAERTRPKPACQSPSAPLRASQLCANVARLFPGGRSDIVVRGETKCGRTVQAAPSVAGARAVPGVAARPAAPLRSRTQDKPTLQRHFVQLNLMQSHRKSAISFSRSQLSKCPGSCGVSEGPRR